LPATASWEYKRKVNVNNGNANDQWGKTVAINGFNIVTGTDLPLSYGESYFPKYRRIINIPFGLIFKLFADVTMFKKRDCACLVSSAVNGQNCTYSIQSG
jgi:hypothetical protein